MVEVLIERHTGSETDPWKNNPIYMTGPAVLTHTAQLYFKLPYPVSGWLGRIYHVSPPLPISRSHVIHVQKSNECSSSL